MLHKDYTKDYKVPVSRLNSPPAFSNGWFLAAYSHEIAEGKVYPYRYFAKDLIIYRGESSRVRIFDATCPHLGAHIGYGGTVKGEGVVCPFHHAEFDETGRMTHIPSADDCPRVDIKPWHVREQNGFIWIWYHADGWAPDSEPVSVPQAEDSEWTDFSAQGCQWFINAYPQMIHENAVDVSHFTPVHDMASMKVHESGVTDDNVLFVDFEHWYRYPEFGVEDPIRLKTYLRLFGLGVDLQETSSDLGIDSVGLITTTPVDEHTLDLRIAMSAKKISDDDAENEKMLASVMEKSALTMEEDIPIWSNREYGVTHMSRGDKYVAAYRKWARNLYSGHVINAQKILAAG